MFHEIVFYKAYLYPCNWSVAVFTIFIFLNCDLSVSTSFFLQFNGATFFNGSLFFFLYKVLLAHREAVVDLLVAVEVGAVAIANLGRSKFKYVRN